MPTLLDEDPDAYRLLRQPRKATVEELREIAQRASTLVEGPYLDHGDFLYDEHGLLK